MSHLAMEKWKPHPSLQCGLHSPKCSCITTMMHHGQTMADMSNHPSCSWRLRSRVACGRELTNEGGGSVIPCQWHLQQEALYRWELCTRRPPEPGEALYDTMSLFRFSAATLQCQKHCSIRFHHSSAFGYSRAICIPTIESNVRENRQPQTNASIVAIGRERFWYEDKIREREGAVNDSYLSH
jgi:hypothetical protein